MRRDLRFQRYAAWTARTRTLPELPRPSRERACPTAQMPSILALPFSSTLLRPWPRRAEDPPLRAAMSPRLPCRGFGWTSRGQTRRAGSKRGCMREGACRCRAALLASPSCWCYQMVLDWAPRARAATHAEPVDHMCAGAPRRSPKRVLRG